MWQARPVFISSTFLDMQAERDYLRTRVFPELEEKLRARRHNLEWVDLRVGVATAAERDANVRELHVLKVCLAEVKRCRPFLIVLLGDRYGWAPPEDRIKAAAAEEGFSVKDIAGRSITDLEIDFGVLSDPEQQPRSMFYFRDPLPYRDMPPQVAALFSNDYEESRLQWLFRCCRLPWRPRNPGAADRARRLALLKQRIETQLPKRVQHYTAQWDAEHKCVTGLEDFGRMVLEDIWSELEVETRAVAAIADLPWQQAEREALEDFVDDRARDFVGRENIIDRVIAFAAAAGDAGAAWGMCVTGDPGCGKSALFGELYRRLGDNVFLLAHAAGASVAAARVDSMLRRWIGELAAALNIREVGLSENADAEAVETTFARLLHQMASRRRAVVLIDALDQFEATTRGRFVTWLPRMWPGNARLVATAIPDEASKALAERPDMKTLALPLLDAAEARDIIGDTSDGIRKGICGRYHRTFEPEVIDALLGKRTSDGPAWGNPLWLVLAVEELNLLDAEDFAQAHDYEGMRPDQQLRKLMLDHIGKFPDDIPGLYEHTFVRAEKLFGERLTRAFLGLIAVSRAGWREIDLRILLPRASGENWDELQFAQLRRVFRGQMRRRGALDRWDFNHAQMRVAVRARLTAVGISEQNLHTMIADRLLSCPPDDELHISETMVHLLASEDYARAAGYFGASSLTEAELKGATRVLADSITAPPVGTAAMAARDICRLLKFPDPSVRAEAGSRFLFDLDVAIQQNAPLDARLIVLNSAQQAFELLLRSDPGNALWQHVLSVSYEKLGDVLVAQGDLSGALKSYRDGLAIFDQLVRSDPDNAGWQRDLSVSYGKVADVQVARGDLAGALELYQADLAIMQRLAHSDPGNAGWQRDLSVSYGNVANLEVAQGDLASGLKFYRDSLAITERLAQSDPGNTLWQRDLSASYVNVGDVQVAQGDLAGALKSYHDGLVIFERLAQFDPGNTLWQSDLSASLSKIGDALIAQGDLAGALKSYRQSLVITERLAKSDPTNARRQRSFSVTAQY